MFTVNNGNDSGAGSLRQAIVNANSTPGQDTINFNIPGSGVHFILPTTALPTVTESVILDATTQPGYAGTPLIELSGVFAPTGTSGLTLQTIGSQVRGLAISAFLGDGLVIQGGGGNFVSFCYLGPHASGNPGGNGFAGVAISNGSVNNVIGGNDVISGNGVFGAVVFGQGATGNTVGGDLIGTNPAGTAAAANGLAGVDVQGGAANNVFTFDVVSGNSGFGFLIADPGTNSNTLANDFVGTDVPGSAALGNGFAGVGIGNGAANNSVGGAAMAAGDLISGNGAHGVYIVGAGTTGNVVQNDKVGTNAAGTAAVANGADGVLIQDGASGNGVVSNLISGNGQFAVQISGAGTANNNVLFSRIGVTADGSAGLANNGGVFLAAGATGNTLFGDVLGSNFNEVEIRDAGTNGNVIRGCFLGTNAAGTAVLSSSNGVSISGGASGNTVGGMTAGSANVIAGAGQGVNIQGAGTNNNAVLDNFVGVNSAGTALGNSTGIFVNSAAGTVIVGNLISANSTVGVGLFGGVTGSVVQGNFIGTNFAGTTAQANQDGVAIDGSNNTVGGTTAGTRNLISGNSRYGVLIMGSGNVVEGNLIGTKADGTSALGNGSHGVFVTTNGTPAAANNTVGGAAEGAGNVIAFNSGNGVLIGSDLASPLQTAAGTGNSVLGDSIFGNGRLGIDLGPNDGVTANDSAGHVGPNNFQNFPVLTSARSLGGLTVIQGTLSSGAAFSTFRIELFANPTADASGHGQGKTFLGFVSLFINVGTTSFSALLGAPTTTGEAISATATDASGDTSEFSADVTVL
jgi:titin